MPTQNEITAREVFQVIPLVMRILAFQMRQGGYELVPAQMGVLGMLLKGPKSLGELAKAQGVRPPTMTHTIRTLSERGWVHRGPSASDRRVVLIELTPQGRGVLQEVQREAEGRLAELLAALFPEECEELMRGLAVLRAAFARASANSGQEMDTSDGCH